MVALLLYPYLVRSVPVMGMLSEKRATQGKIQKKSKGSKSFGSSSLPRWQTHNIGHESLLEPGAKPHVKHFIE